MNSRSQYMAYMSGWRAGAAFNVFEPQQEALKVIYEEGYSAGRAASRAAGQKATWLTGYEPPMIKTLVTDKL